MAQRNGTSHLIHAFITLFTCGLWVVVWFLAARSKEPFRCQACGAVASGLVPPRQASGLAVVLRWVGGAALAALAAVLVVIIGAAVLRKGEGGTVESQSSGPLQIPEGRQRQPKQTQEERAAATEQVNQLLASDREASQRADAKAAEAKRRAEEVSRVKDAFYVAQEFARKAMLSPKSVEFECKR